MTSSWARPGVGAWPSWDTRSRAAWVESSYQGDPPEPQEEDVPAGQGHALGRQDDLELVDADGRPFGQVQGHPGSRAGPTDIDEDEPSDDPASCPLVDAQRVRVVIADQRMRAPAVVAELWVPDVREGIPLARRLRVEVVVVVVGPGPEDLRRVAQGLATEHRRIGCLEAPAEREDRTPPHEAGRGEHPLAREQVQGAGAVVRPEDAPSHPGCEVPSPGQVTVAGQAVVRARVRGHGPGA